MKKILKIDNPNDFARFVDAPELHPLVSIIHYDELAPFRHSLNNYGVYGLFIQRQLSEEDSGNSDLLKRFHDLLQQYFRENRQLTQGLPTVAYCASELAYSPRYFGDIVHKATGGTAIGYIHNYVINQAKSLLMNGHNISETSRLLGFDFPHHFTRLFKKMTGLTPSEYLGK